MPETPDAGEIVRRLNEAKARAADADRRADELTRAAEKKGRKDAVRAAEEDADEAYELFGPVAERSQGGGDEVSPPSAFPDWGLMEQANAARREADAARAEAERLNAELAAAPQASRKDADRLRRDAGNDRILKQDAAENRSRQPSSAAPQTAPTTPTTPTTTIAPAQTPAETAAELDRIGFTHQPGSTPGGITATDAERVGVEMRRGDPSLPPDVAAALIGERTSLDVQAPDPDPLESILGEIELVDPTIGPTNDQRRAEAAGMATWLYRALRDPTTWIRLAGAGLGALGLFLLMLGLNAQAQQVPGGAAASAPSAAPSASPTQRAPTPISAGPIVVKPIVAVAGPTTEYVVAIERMPPQDAPTFSWSGATCGMATATANRYSWDHREQVVSITGGLGSGVLGRSGNCDHRADPSHGNPLIVAEITSRSFTARCTFHGAGSGTGEPCEVKAATAPAAAAPAATPGTAAVAVADGGGANVPLAALGFVLLVGAIGLFFGGPRLAGGPEEPSWWSQFKEWWSSRGKDHAKHAVDVVAEGTGTLPPFKAAEIVDIVVEATPSIMETKEAVEEYRENVHPDEDTLGIYNNLDNVPEKPTLSQRFFKWFNSLVR